MTAPASSVQGMCELAASTYDQVALLGSFLNPRLTKFSWHHFCFRPDSKSSVQRNCNLQGAAPSERKGWAVAPIRQTGMQCQTPGALPCISHMPVYSYHVRRSLGTRLAPSMFLVSVFKHEHRPKLPLVRSPDSAMAAFAGQESGCTPNGAKDHCCPADFQLLREELKVPWRTAW